MEQDTALDPSALNGIDTLDGLAALLRRLRRRHARQCGDSPLTYRELAARTGWAHGVIGDYFTGKALAPTDRFDVLVSLLGASAAEVSGLATVRDRVEEARRGRRARETTVALGPLPTEVAVTLSGGAELTHPPARRLTVPPGRFCVRGIRDT